MADEEQLTRLLRSVEEWNEWKRNNWNIEIDLSSADLSEIDLIDADLSNADLSNAQLYRTNLSEANLYKANLSNAQLYKANLYNTNLREAGFYNANLYRANLYNADLSNAGLYRASLKSANLRNTNLRSAYLCETNLSDTNFRSADLYHADLSKADLSKADLRSASLFNTYLYKADFSNANLSEAHLIQTQALNTNFKGANLTGACIEDWNINSNTKLVDVYCEYIYLGIKFSNLKQIYTDRRPSDPSKIFALGDFARLVQKAHETIDLIFRNGIDWQAFSNSFQALTADRIKIEGSDRAFSIRAIENLDDGSFVVRINTPKDADKAAIERTFQTKYEAELKQLEAVYRERLQAKDEQIEIYKKQSADIMELTKLAIARDVRTINITGNDIKGTSYTEELKGSGYTQRDNQVNEA